MRAKLTVVIGALALAAACGNGRGDSAPTEAGSVTSVSGEVKATRADAADARSLSVGDTVYTDDTIATGPDATVTIALTHNGAQWTLGADTARRVDQSAAWRAPKGSGEATFVTGDPDRTASAGRHTEAVPEVVRDSESPPPAPPAAEPAGPPPPPEPKPEPKERRVKRRETHRSPPKDDKKDLLGDGLLFEDEPAPGEPKLTREQILAALKKVQPAVNKCAAKHDGKGVIVKVKILIGKDGSVSGALPMGDQEKTELGRCVAGAVRAARFPKNGGPPYVIYPFKL